MPASMTGSSSSPSSDASRCAGPAPAGHAQDGHAQQRGGWLVCLVSCAEVPARPLPPSGKETGIDVGLQVFLVTADAWASRIPATTGGGRRSWQRRSAASRAASGAATEAQGRRVPRSRAPGGPATAGRLPPQDGAGAAARLRHDLSGRPAGRQPVRNRRLAKSIGDAGWARFLAILEAKAACAGRRVVAVHPPTPVRTVVAAGTRVPKSLSVRTHVCPTCGLVLDRDEHAARNIQWRGQRLRGLAEVSAGTNREPMGL